MPLFCVRQRHPNMYILSNLGHQTSFLILICLMLCTTTVPLHQIARIGEASLNLTLGGASAALTEIHDLIITFEGLNTGCRFLGCQHKKPKCEFMIWIDPEKLLLNRKCGDYDDDTTYRIGEHMVKSWWRCNDVAHV
jgi:hypothetical protein